MPIFYGTSNAILKIGAGQIEGTSGLGQIGNTVLASHRSHTFGRLFNRLDELKAGDEIYVVVKDKTYKYKVYDKLVVLPKDVSVLKRNKTDKLLTLVTCDPMINPTHRLIIQAKIAE
jgi:sortase A